MQRVYVCERTVCIFYLGDFACTLIFTSWRETCHTLIAFEISIYAYILFVMVQTTERRRKKHCSLLLCPLFFHQAIFRSWNNAMWLQWQSHVAAAAAAAQCTSSYKNSIVENGINFQKFKIMHSDVMLTRSCRSHHSTRKTDMVAGSVVLALGGMFSFEYVAFHVPWKSNEI